MNSLNYSTIAEVTAAVRARKVSPVELVEATLARIEKLEPKLTAFMNLDAAGARNELQSRWQAKQEELRLEKEQIENGIKSSTDASQERWKYRLAVWQEKTKTEKLEEAPPK